MRTRIPVTVGLLAVAAAGLFALQIPSAEEKVKPLYSVSKYDPKRDPVKDLADTVAIAKKDNRHILLLVGGDW